MYLFHRITQKITACPFVYFTSKIPFYPKVTDHIGFSNLPEMPYPRRIALTKDRCDKMREWRLEFGQSVRQKTIRNMSTKDNPGTLPLNVYLEKPSINIVSLVGNHEQPTAEPVDTRDPMYKVGDLCCIANHGVLQIIKLSKAVFLEPDELAEGKVFEESSLVPFEFILKGMDSVNSVQIKGVITEYQEVDEDTLCLDEDQMNSMLALLDQGSIMTAGEVAEIDDDSLMADMNDQPAPRRVHRPKRVRKRPHMNDFFYYDSS